MTPKLTTERLILREIKGNDLFGYYELRSDPQTMKLFGAPVLTDDLEYIGFVQRMRSEREQGIVYFWTITIKEEKEFVGFVRLMSYNSGNYDVSFSLMGEYRFDKEFLKDFDRINGWEITYALVSNQRNKGIMREAVGAVLKFCEEKKLSPIYAMVHSMSNFATVKVLRYHNFKEHSLLGDPELFEMYDAKSPIEKNEIGMIFKWTT